MWEQIKTDIIYFNEQATNLASYCLNKLRKHNLYLQPLGPITGLQT